MVDARAVVAKSIAPYSIVVGNPARFSRMRLEESTIAKLEALKWWDWPDEVLLQAMPDLLTADISTLFKRASSSYKIDLARAKK